jgi:uncharacterized metal-binding protein YceD (DUF177 family)
MKINPQQIPEEGKHIEGEVDPSILDLHDPDIVPESQIHYCLDVGLSDDGLFATGSLSLKLRLRCVRCLDPFSFPVEIPDFACQFELSGNETVDLTPSAREDILLALPVHPHCDWDGRNPCKPPLQGQSKALSNEGPESAQNLQGSEGRSDVWGKLDQLNLKKKEA